MSVKANEVIPGMKFEVSKTFNNFNAGGSNNGQNVTAGSIITLKSIPKKSGASWIGVDVEYADGTVCHSFWSLLYQNIKPLPLDKQPQAIQDALNAKASAPPLVVNKTSVSLSPEEEASLIFMHNGKKLYYTGAHPYKVDAAKGEEQHGDLLYTSKFAGRKRFKKIVALYGVLNYLATGLTPVSQQSGNNSVKLSRQERVNASGYLDLAWQTLHQPLLDIKSLESVQIFKYNTKDKKFYDEEMELNAYKYIKKQAANINLCIAQGEAVSNIVSGLAKESKPLEGFIVELKYDALKLGQYESAPKDKDASFEVVMKRLNVNKKTSPTYNKNGFAGVYFETLDKAQEFSLALKAVESNRMISSIVSVSSLDKDLLLDIKDFFDSIPSNSTNAIEELDSLVSSQISPSTKKSSIK